MSKSNTPEIVVLTVNQELLRKLHNKRSEYVKRNQFVAPEVDTTGYLKMTLLGILVDSGTLAVDAERAKLREKLDFADHTFDHVVRIINYYNSGDTSALVGGSGLKN